MKNDKKGLLYHLKIYKINIDFVKNDRRFTVYYLKFNYSTKFPLHVAFNQ